MIDFEAIISNLSVPQRETLDRIATGQSQGTNTQILKALEAKGLIDSHERTERGRFTWVEYVTPTHIHIAWAAVCSAEFDALSSEERAAMEAPDA